MFWQGHKEDLVLSVKTWIAKEIISEDQGKAILAEYSLSIDDHPGSSFAIRMLGGLGYLFVGLAILLLVGSNWEQLPREVRAGSLVLLLSFLNWKGFVALRNGNLNTAANLLLLAGICFGANIFLIAQTYHINTGAIHEALMYWGLGVLPSVFATRDSKVHLLFAGISLSYLIVCFTSGLLPLAYYPAAAVSMYLLLTGIESKFAFLLTLGGVGLLIPATIFGGYYNWDNQLGFELTWALELSYGLLVLLATPALNSLKTSKYAREYAKSLKMQLIKIVTVVMFIFSFRFAWVVDSLILRSFSGFITTIFLVTTSLGILLIWLRKYFKWDSVVPLFDYCAFLFFIMLGMRWVILKPAPDLYSYTEQAKDPLSLIFCIIVNIMIFALGVYFMQLSAKINSRAALMYGVLILSALAFARYISLVGNYFGASLLFIVEGLLLIYVARNSDRLMKKMEV